MPNSNAHKLRLTSMTRVLSVERENARTVTLTLDAAFSAQPGQFVMCWLPGVDEKPFSISYSDGAALGLTVAAIGPFSQKIAELKPDNRIGLRGPFGKSFKLEGSNVAVVGGGCGSAPLAFLVEKLVAAKKKVHFIAGARSQDDLLFVERAKKAGANVIVCTDDGSAGRKGFTTDALAELLEKEKIDAVYTCGPELMMKKVADLCARKGVACQASLERFMKCGFGLCGQCAIDEFLVCSDGPVFPLAKLQKMKEFGSVKRDACGLEISFKPSAPKN